MPTPYTGDPVATQAPATAPEPDWAPIANVPLDGDPPAASTFSQPYKVLADAVAWLFRPRAKSLSYAQAIQKWRNARLQPRALIDHMGFPGGDFFTYREDWAWNQATAAGSTGTGDVDPAKRWSYRTVGDGTIVFSGGTGSSLPYRHAVARVGGLVSDFTNVFTEELVNLRPEIGCAFEFSVRPDHLNADLWIGLGQTLQDGLADPTSLGNARRVYFRKTTAGANWQFEVANGSAVTSVDTGVAPIATTGVQILRLEYQGSSVSDDSNNRVLAFINGVQVANISTNVPTTGGFCLCFGIMRRALGTSSYQRVGAIRGHITLV